MAEGTVRGLVVVTTCETVEAFVERYWSRVGSKWLFVSAIDERVVGQQCAFAILLADKRPVLAGITTVVEVFRDTNNQFRRAGMVLRIQRLGLESERVFNLLVTRASGRSRLARGSDGPLSDSEMSLVHLTEVENIPIHDDDGIPIDIDDART
jgi:hypothetical protein